MASIHGYQKTTPAKLIATIEIDTIILITIQTPLIIFFLCPRFIVMSG